MKKYLVIGNPIGHSFSPKLHNYWIKVNNLKAIYEKKKLCENEIENLILQVREKKIHGINVTVPFKKAVIPPSYFFCCRSDIASHLLSSDELGCFLRAAQHKFSAL